MKSLKSILQLVFSIILFLIACTSKQKTDNNKLAGMYKLHNIEMQNSAGVWHEQLWTKGGDSYIVYDGLVMYNGNGIPQKVLDKVFQPFFTTKPTGQGTGLGLSLAYDIVKAHGGEIKVKTSEGEGTTFNIYLPITNA